MSMVKPGDHTGDEDMLGDQDMLGDVRWTVECARDHARDHRDNRAQCHTSDATKCKQLFLITYVYIFNLAVKVGQGFYVENMCCVR